MKSVRILVFRFPEILRQILEDALLREPEFEVTFLGSPRDAALAAVERPQIAIVRMESGVPSDCRDLLRRFPEMRILGLKAHGRRAFVVELEPHCTSLGELSPGGLVEAIRAAVERPNVLERMAEL